MTFRRHLPWLLATLAASVSAQNTVPNLGGDPLPARATIHTPRLQLGILDDDKPVPDTDQIVLIWQTQPAQAESAAGTQSTFSVEYRLEGEEEWLAAQPITQFRANSLPNPSMEFDIGEFLRIIHESKVSGLDFNTRYEYRWQHFYDGELHEEQIRPFTTRIQPGDETPFTFLHNADSAGDGREEGFNTVGVLNQLLGDAGEVAFSIANGDNAYDEGFHSQYDRRLSPSYAPEHTDFLSKFIEFASIGNHDIYNSATAVRDNYAPPKPRVSDPLGIDEHYYSFDWGIAHFSVIDGNAAGQATGGAFFANPLQFDSLIEWLRQDMESTDAKWKFIISHFPIGGSPDKQEGPADAYWQQVVAMAEELDIDVIMGGHSHTYSRSWPLVTSGDATAKWIPGDGSDPDVTLDSYTKNKGLVQVVAGNGGTGLRPGVWNEDNTGNAGGWVPVGYSTDTTPAVEWGLAQVDVSPQRLRISYVRAIDGEVIDTFEIVDNELAPAATDAAPRPSLKCASDRDCDTNAFCFETLHGSSLCQCNTGFKGDGLSCAVQMERAGRTSTQFTAAGMKASDLMTSSGRRALKRAVATTLGEVKAGHVEVDHVNLVATSTLNGDLVVDLDVYSPAEDSWDLREAFKRQTVHDRLAGHLRTNGLRVRNVSPRVGSAPTTYTWEQQLGAPFPSQATNSNTVEAAAAAQPAVKTHATASSSSMLAGVGIGLGAAGVLAAGVVVAKNLRARKQEAQTNLDAIANNQA